MKARYNKENDTYQDLDDHLFAVAKKAAHFSENLGFSDLAYVAGLLHDLGKSCTEWQEYLKASVAGSKGKEDHATAGGQYIQYIDYSLIKQILQTTIMYHHGCGLPDMLTLSGDSPFLKRLEKNKTNLELSEKLKKEINFYLSKNLEKTAQECFGKDSDCYKFARNEKQLRFNQGLHLRLFDSCLIDADRTNSCEFELGEIDDFEKYANWSELKKRLEQKLSTFSNTDTLGQIRKKLSDKCAEFGKKEKGIYTCSAFTGSGKTLASLRFALEQAKKHKMKRIFIIAPYTSIIDQNADEIRKILEDENSKGKIVLECHSNLSKDKKEDIYETKSYDLQIENWNAPVIVTTMVQFLETLFGSGTKSIRRMHTLAESVLIFDEIQTLPIKTTDMFRCAIEYLVNCCKCSVMLCTATQPCLDKIGDEAFRLKFDNEIISDVKKHFSSLKRVRFIDKSSGGRKKTSEEKIAEYITEQMQTYNSFLAVVNTKPQAKKLFELLKDKETTEHIFHLSTSMCPAHRKDIIKKIKDCLKNKIKVICVSTQLIEAGVDLSFEGCLRYMAGLDSIIQTAGRCNRNNELPEGGTCAIFSIKDENLNFSSEIKCGKECMERILRDIKTDKTDTVNLITPDIIEAYFNYYYAKFDNSNLQYYLKDKKITIMDLLSDNKEGLCEYRRINKGKNWNYPFRQAFETAWKKFEVIAELTTGVLVPYGEGKNIIGKISSLETSDKEYFKDLNTLLNSAQQYTVNVYTNKLEILKRIEMIYELIAESGIYALHDEFYDKNLGMTNTANNENISVLYY